jgi:hypothetical protein
MCKHMDHIRKVRLDQGYISNNNFLTVYFKGFPATLLISAKSRSLIVPHGLMEPASMWVDNEAILNLNK